MRDARGRFLAGSFYDLAGAADYLEFVLNRPRQFQITDWEILSDVEPGESHDEGGTVRPTIVDQEA